MKSRSDKVSFCCHYYLIAVAWRPNVLSAVNLHRNYSQDLMLCLMGIRADRLWSREREQERKFKTLKCVVLCLHIENKNEIWVKWSIITWRIWCCEVKGTYLQLQICWKWRWFCLRGQELALKTFPVTNQIDNEFSQSFKGWW